MYCYKKITVLDREISIDVKDTGAGISILIAGGDKGHIGAIAVAESGKIIESITLPGHKESVICETWGRKVSETYCGPVIVEAGVHYDHITGEQIREVLGVLEKELEAFVEEYIERKGVKHDGTYFCYK